jgi:multidrug efflux pump subunit AcrA (membrane-fusion protein)
MTPIVEPLGHVPTTLRVVVSPGTGRLRYLPPRRFAGGVELVEAGQPVARLTGTGDDVLVRAPVDGRVSSVLGIEGEPVVAGQAVLAIEPAAS